MSFVAVIIRTRRPLLQRVAVATLLSLAGAVPVIAQAGAVTGVVVDERSNTPIPKARVSVPGTTVQTLTDATGRFRLEVFNGTEVPLQVTVIGYRPLSQTVRV